MPDHEDQMSIRFASNPNDGECDKSCSIIRVCGRGAKEDGENGSDSADRVVAEKPVAKDAEYNPHEHGQQRRPVHRVGATLLLLKYIIGAGILAMPYTFCRVGYLVGILGTVFVSLLYLHIMHLLLQLEYDLCTRIQLPRLTFVGVVRKSFEYGWQKVRPLEPCFVGLMYFNYGVSNILYNVVCLILMAGGMRDIVNHSGIAQVSIQSCLTYIMVPLTAICWIPNLKFLVPFSALTNAFTLLSMAAILFVPTTSTEVAATAAAAAAAPPKAWGDLTYFPQFFAIVMGSFSCTGLVLPLKNDMAKPKYFTSPLGVLNVSLLLVAVLYSCFSTRAYFKYGESVQGNVLRNLPENQLVSVAVRLSYAVAVAISFTYSFYITFDTLWSNYLGAELKGNRYKVAIKYATKTLINMLIYVLAVAVPNFKLFVALSGSVGIVADIGVPSLLHIIMLMRNKLTASSVLVILKDALIATLAVSMFLSSFVKSLLDIVELYTR